MTTKTIGKGTKFRSTLQDGNPLWEVTRKRTKGVWEAKVIDSPDFEGHVDVFTEQAIRTALGWATMFEQAKAASDRFYANLTRGQIVHYHNGFNAFVRCEVTADRELKPIALVGNWSRHELPHRRPDGTIEYPYHVKKIQAGETFTPQSGNVYECDPKGKQDPREMPALDLSVPEMTPEEVASAKLWAAVYAAKEALDPREAVPGLGDAKARLEAALKVIQGVLTA